MRPRFRPLLFLMTALPLGALAQTLDVPPTHSAAWTVGVTPLAVASVATQQTGAAAGGRFLNLGPAIEGFARYTLPAAPRWRVEAGAGFGLLGGLGFDASQEIGLGGAMNLAGVRAFGRAARVVPLGRAGKWSAQPHLGLTLTRLSRSQDGYTTPQPIIYNNPEAGSQAQRQEVYQHSARLGYDVGLTLAQRLGAVNELGLTVRYGNSFSKQAVAATVLSYDSYGVPQPEIRSVSRLESFQVGLTLSGALRAQQ